AFELDLPQAGEAPRYQIEVREALSGQTAAFDVQGSKFSAANLALEPDEQPAVPRPAEVRGFLKQAKKVAIVPAAAIPGCQELAVDLQKRLEQEGVTARVAEEGKAYRLPLGDPQAEDPLGDGFHSWHSGQEAIAPALVVDEDVILLGGRHSSLLIDALA